MWYIATKFGFSYYENNYLPYVMLSLKKKHFRPDGKNGNFHEV